MTTEVATEPLRLQLVKHAESLSGEARAAWRGKSRGKKEKP